VQRMSNTSDHVSPRGHLERALGSDLRILTSESDWTLRSFAAQHDLAANDFRSILFVIVAEAAGERLTAGELRRKIGLSGAAITYMVERLTELGYLLREADPNDRRKVILRPSERAMNLARSFFVRINDYSRDALQIIDSSDLEAAHRTFSALTTGMQGFRAMTSGLAAPTA
jgi:DNA-binding MarR family transcriptional regulator